MRELAGCLLPDQHAQAEAHLLLLSGFDLRLFEPGRPHSGSPGSTRCDARDARHRRCLRRRRGQTGAAAARPASDSGHVEGLVEVALALALDRRRRAPRGDLTVLALGARAQPPELGRELGVEERAAEASIPSGSSRSRSAAGERACSRGCVEASSSSSWDASDAGGLRRGGSARSRVAVPPRGRAVASRSRPRRGSRAPAPRPAPTRSARRRSSGSSTATCGEARRFSAGIRRLEGGQLLRLEDGRWRAERYWSPRYVPPAAPTPPRPAELVVAALVDAVSGRMAAGADRGAPERRARLVDDRRGRKPARAARDPGTRVLTRSSRARGVDESRLIGSWRNRSGFRATP